MLASTNEQNKNKTGLSFGHFQIPTCCYHCFGQLMELMVCLSPLLFTST